MRSFQLHSTLATPKPRRAADKTVDEIAPPLFASEDMKAGVGALLEYGPRAGEIGWGSTYTFEGIPVAALVMTVFDTFIWPSPPEPRLLEALAAGFDRMRRRLELAGQRCLDPLAEPCRRRRLNQCSRGIWCFSSQSSSR